MDKHFLHFFDLVVCLVVVPENRHIFEFIIFLVDELNVNGRFFMSKVLLFKEEDEERRADSDLIILGIDNHIKFLLFYNSLFFPTGPQLIQILFHLTMLYYFW